MSTLDKIKAKVENVIHPHDHTTTHTTSTTHSTGTTHGAGTHSGVPEGVAGPHSSRAANAADPRVDSDLDHRGAAGNTTGLTGGTAGTTGTGYGGTTGTTGTTGTSGVTGGTAGTGYGTTGTTGTTGSTTAHSSNLANKLDPRVDSTTANTYSGTHAGNNQGGFTGTTGGISNSTNAGPHNSNLANKADPRVDSDLDGRGNRHGAATGIGSGITGASGSHATPGSGTAQNTAGPHNSDLANKIDPRVDADLDGSTTIGGNRTHRDTHFLDASKVPPSVFAARQGEPEILHGDRVHDHAGRHGIVISDQSQLSGV